MPPKLRVAIESRPPILWWKSDPKLAIFRNLHGTLVGSGSTSVPFQALMTFRTLFSEQFWGRAARASKARKSRDAC